MNINLAQDSLECYKVPMNESKTDMIGVMVTPSIKDFIRKIAESEDRSLSYVTGALLMRGIAAYEKDNLLKDPHNSANSRVASVPIVKVNQNDTEKEQKQKERKRKTA